MIKPIISSVVIPKPIAIRGKQTPAGEIVNHGPEGWIIDWSQVGGFVELTHSDRPGLRMLVPFAEVRIITKDE